jgi:hypothetical protein
MNADPKKPGVAAAQAYFQNAGYRGMYNMNLNKLRERKGVPSSRSPLDFMGATESAANLLRIRLTEDKINVDHAQGQNALENTAANVGKEVRDLLKRTIGKTPESLPPAPDIRQVHRGLKDTSKGFKAIDAPKNKKFVRTANQKGGPGHTPRGGGGAAPHGLSTLLRPSLHAGLQ